MSLIVYENSLPVHIFYSVFFKCVSVNMSTSQWMSGTRYDTHVHIPRGLGMIYRVNMNIYHNGCRGLGMIPIY